MDGAKARSIDDIRSFATLEAVVTDMQARKDELGIEGVFAPVSLQHGEDWPWQTHLFNEALYYEWTDKGVDVSDGHTPLTIGFDYAQNFKQLFDLYLQNNAGRPGDTAHVTVDDMMTTFAQGKAAMVQNGNWSFSQIINAPGSVVNTGDLGFLPMYFGVEGEEGQGLCVGCENYYCINRFADAESQKASLDFLTWLYTSEEGMQMVNGDLGFLPPFDTFTPLSEGSGNALSREVLRWDSGMTDIRNIPWVFDVIPNQRFKNTFGGYLQQYAIGSLSWDELVDKTVSEWTLQADGK
jgi:raffinose/stachyose/melibiose transport system substrate-binding protein